MNWYDQREEEVLKNLGTTIKKGLMDIIEIEKRLEFYGNNEFQKKLKVYLEIYKYTFWS